MDFHVFVFWNHWQYASHMGKKLLSKKHTRTVFSCIGSTAKYHRLSIVIEMFID